MSSSSPYKAFTLIELLVVIAIIGILTAIVMANFTAAKSKSRDAKRVSDIAQIQLTLELVYDRCSSYPSAITETTSICNSLTVGSFISKVPTDNYAGTSYAYAINGNATDYVLQARLENSSAVPPESVTVPTINPPSGNCAAPYYCVQSK